MGVWDAEEIVSGRRLHPGEVQGGEAAVALEISHFLAAIPPDDGARDPTLVLREARIDRAKAAVCFERPGGEREQMVRFFIAQVVY